MDTLDQRLDLPASPTSRSAWTVEMGLRMRRYFALKVVGTTAVTAVFFVAYLHLLHHPVYPVTVMPLTALDRLIPFAPQALIAYLSLWIYVGAGPGLQLTLTELLVYALWIVALCVTGLAVFYRWPTEVPPLALDTSAFLGFPMLRAVDAAGNACPSMHVAVATFTVLRIDDVLRRAGVPVFGRLLNLVWFAAIALSTLATKQHVVLDALAGAVLGVAFASASMRWRPPPDVARRAVIAKPRRPSAR